MKNIALLSMLLLSGCFSAGQKRITDDHLIAKIEKERSTKAEIEWTFGRPGAVDFTESGREKWVYFYSRGEVRLATFIPIVGLFVGGSDSRMDSLSILFSSSGIVENFGRSRTDGSSGF